MKCATKLKKKRGWDGWKRRYSNIINPFFIGLSWPSFPYGVDDYETRGGRLDRGCEWNQANREGYTCHG